MSAIWWWWTRWRRRQGNTPGGWACQRKDPFDYFIFGLPRCDAYDIIVLDDLYPIAYGKYAGLKHPGIEARPAGKGFLGDTRYFFFNEEGGYVTAWRGIAGDLHQHRLTQAQAGSREDERPIQPGDRSEEHTSELQSPTNL